MNNLTKKLGVGILSILLLGSGCATQNYSTKTNGSLLNNSEYAMTKDILKKENRYLNKLERKYNNSLERGETVQSPEFLRLFQEYQHQKSMVQNYQNILELTKGGK
jgi:uncharacterized protein YecA (UPF0149 family)